MDPIAAKKARRVLLVDDDPVVLKIYQTGLKSRGFEVDTASDGLAAVKLLQTARPDLIVLDLMMPKMSGVDVLKFVRGQRSLAELPVVVLSNAYMDGLARDAAAVGAQKALLKAGCTPAQLAVTIEEVLQGRDSGQDASQLLAAPQGAPAETKQSRPVPAAPPPSFESEVLKVEAPSPRVEEGKPSAAAREAFLKQSATTAADLRTLFQAFASARNEAERDVRLQSLYRKVHFVTAAAGLAGCWDVVRMATAFEALLFEAMEKRARTSASMIRTISASVDFLKILFEHPADLVGDENPWATALVVDNDPLSNRLVGSALRTAQVKSDSVANPLAALERLTGNPCDLVILEIASPKMDGVEFCRQLRRVPGHQTTPLIYLVAHEAFDQRAAALKGGEEDLITKPVFPMELAVKAVMHLLQRRLRR